MAWLGQRKIAFIPLSRTGITPPDVIPDDWSDLITQRLLSFPEPTGDRSVNAYFEAVSSGLAGLDVVVLPAQTIAEDQVPPDALEATMGAQLRSEGFVGAAIVMLGGPGGGSTAQLSNFGWSRFCMSDDLGNWVGELLHQPNLCDLPDLFDFAGNYPADANMGPYDQEAGYEATHLCGWTKRAVGWLEPATVAAHPGGAVNYDLYSVSLPQPAPAGTVAAVQIGATSPYLMVEARLKADQFDLSIPGEGVIVYRVQTTDPLGHAQNSTAPLALITKVALTAGQSVNVDEATITVVGPVQGTSGATQGFAVKVEDAARTGQLACYVDTGTPGNVSGPVVVGFGGWLDFKVLFAGANVAGENRIYAVDQTGQLLSYEDAGTLGNVSSPVVVGFGGWSQFAFLFAGKNLAGENRIYAVNPSGQLLSYGDDGTAGNVSAPVIVGFGGWLGFKFLFAGQNLAGENVIYAVNQDGQLLSYRDNGGAGNVSDPVIVGFGGWSQFSFLFAGKSLSGEARIYAVNQTQNGQLLSYGDAGTPGNVSSPVVVGFDDWLDFKFLFSGANVSGENCIYAVVA
jgi:hypothetical protein